MLALSPPGVASATKGEVTTAGEKFAKFSGVINVTSDD
jgi:hypothetical protein